MGRQASVSANPDDSGGVEEGGGLGRSLSAKNVPLTTHTLIILIFFLKNILTIMTYIFLYVFLYFRYIYNSS
jgi:hypothetical protein